MSNNQEEESKPQVSNQNQIIENIQPEQMNMQFPDFFSSSNAIINENETNFENPESEMNNIQNKDLVTASNNFANNNIINIVNTNDNNNSNVNINNNDKEIVSAPNKTPLENRFSFWYRIDTIIQYQLQKQALDKNEYENQVKKIAEFGTIEDFWGIFQHLRKPDSCKAGIEYFMFKEPIKPMWEDENNKNGGRISIKLRKEYTTIIWEEMIFALIGGILPKEMKEEINGIVVTSRKEFNTLQIWFKTYESNIINDLQQCIRDILVIPPEVNLEVKQFNKNGNKKEINNNTNSTSNNSSKKFSGGYYNSKGYNNYYYNDNHFNNKGGNYYRSNKFPNYKNK